MNIFEKYKKTTSISIIVLFVLLFLVLVEIILSKFGLGKPILYDSSAIYGYRPIANKTYSRYMNKTIHFNNLALRAKNDWDTNHTNKILFLGDSVTYGGSYIDNNELFSTLAVDIINQNKKTKYLSGNAGVNAWGVENVYALVVQSNFLPANIYVSMFPEGDFYRGLSRISGMPFYNNPPKYALEELWLYFCWKQNNHRYKNWQNFSSVQTKRYVLNKAIKKLSKMDKFIKNKGYKHIILITPTKDELLNKTTKDKMLLSLFKQSNIKVIYLLDYLKKMNLSKTDIDKIYHDSIHLNQFGHKIWAKVIADILINNLKN